MHRKKKLFGLMVIMFAMVVGCFDRTPTQSPSSVVEVEIREDDDGEWRIYDEEGINRGTWTVDEEEEITWKVAESDMIFSFPVDMRTYFDFSRDLFAEIDSSFTGPDGEMEPRRIQTIEEGDSLNFMIKVIESEIEYAEEEAIADTIDYDIYVIDAEKYVIGNSPPILIIRRSHTN